MKRAVRWYDYITINIYWLGLNVASGTITPVLLPYNGHILVGNVHADSADEVAANLELADGLLGEAARRGAAGRAGAMGRLAGAGAPDSTGLRVTRRRGRS